jgi:hypothetical protein
LILRAIESSYILDKTCSISTKSPNAVTNPQEMKSQIADASAESLTCFGGEADTNSLNRLQKSCRISLQIISCWLNLNFASF